MSNELYIMHYGVGHDKGGHSGRYPWGSGKNPKQGLEEYRRMIGRSQNKASYIRQKLWKNVQKAVIKDTGLSGRLKWGNRNNREIVRNSIAKLYKTDPEFRNMVRQSKQIFEDEVKLEVKATKDFINQYENKTPDRQNVQEGTRFLASMQANNKKITMNDVDFATAITFDDRVGKNRATGVVKTVAGVYLGIQAAAIIRAFAIDALRS